MDVRADGYAVKCLQMNHSALRGTDYFVLCILTQDGEHRQLALILKIEQVNGKAIEG